MRADGVEAARGRAREAIPVIAGTGAAVCVCNDSGCGMNIGGLINREWKRCYPQQPAPRLMHIAEVLDEAWG